MAFLAPLLARFNLWYLGRAQFRLSLELAAARDYLSDIESEYRWEGVSRDDLVSEILEVRAKIEALEEEAVYVWSQLKAASPEPTSATGGDT